MTARPRAARRLAGRALSWRALATSGLVLCVALGLGWSVISLRHQADRHWQHDTTLSAAASNAEDQVAASWRCAATGTPTCGSDFDRAGRALDTVVAVTRAGVHGVVVPLRRYQAVVVVERAGLTSTQAATRATAARRIADAEPALSAALGKAAASERRNARSVAHVADLETLLLMLFALAIASLLFRRFSMSHAAGELRAARDRERSEARFRSLVTNASDVVTLTDVEGIIQFQTPSVQRVLGYAPHEGVGLSASDWCHPDDLDIIRAAFVRTLSGEDRVTTVVRWRHADGTWRWLESVRTNLLGDPDVAAVVVNSRDVTEQRELSSQLEHNALHDVLTGLPNRALFVDRVEQALRRGLAPAVLFVDLDDFKAVNDRLGHAAGDAVLREVAARLLAGAEQGDTIARLGADDFAVLLEHADSGDRARLAGERILAALGARIVVGGETVVPQASIGVAVAADGTEPAAADELLSRADLALSAAKGEGKARVVLYDRAMRVALMGALDTKARLAKALRRGELEVHYQPVVELGSGVVVGVEALLRWRDPQRGLVPPEEFIPLVEQSPLIVELGAYVLRTSCLQLAKWRRAGAASAALKVSVNVAARQLEEASFVDLVARCLRESDLAADNLTLEVTEGQLVRDVDASATTLMRLRSLGVRVAIDDFGTGYSSLSYLERLPVNMLKIDRSFVSGGPILGDGSDGSVLLRSIIDLGLALGLQVVAEGIETQEQRRSLHELGCPLGQGYLFAAPLPPDQLLPMLKRRLTAETA